MSSALPTTRPAAAIPAGPAAVRLARALSACILAGLAACGDKAPAPAAPVAKPAVSGSIVSFPSGAPQLAVLKTSPVTPLESGAVELTARLAWDENRTARIYSPFAGRVARIAVQAGDVVKAGQTLASIASPDFGQAQADAAKAAADLVLAEKNLGRIRELHDNGVAPRKDLVQAEAEHARALGEQARAQARARLYGGGTGVDQALTLRSPVAGVVVERNINPGQELRPDQGGVPALFVVTDPSRLWVLIDAHEKELGVLAKGAGFKVRVPTYPGADFAGRLEAVADFVDPQTRVVRARGTLVNADRRLKGEMLVTAVFESAQTGGVEVPARAVLFTDGAYYAFVDRGNGSFERVRVVPGLDRGGRIGVSAGLAAGQRVVAEGALLLQQAMRAGDTKTESE